MTADAGLVARVSRSLVLAWGYSSVSDTSKSDSAAPSAVPSMDWYIIKVAFNREDSIRDALLKRIKLSGLDSCFSEILIPTEDVVTFTRNGTRRVVKRKLYPGYLMARMVITDDSWFLVRETPGVGDFTGAGGKPTPMDPSDVAKIVKPDVPDEEEGSKPMKTSIPYRAGDRARVKEGNFQNLEGEVEKVDEANGRVTVIISIFGRSTPVELDHWQIEKI
ncbi:MAG TPA: transcription termination/antitermination factor NusG [Planctomycetaceae bacterium]|jgi:transcriptional antiterminator NusG|nr:transcription termination/antitermination factor NusG [Planctomycetaceae bacterium]